MKNKILITIFVTITVSAVAWSIPKEDRLADKSNLAPHPQDKHIPEKETVEWKKYHNEEVGISFEYPDIFERVDMQVINGETGRQFIGVLEFYPNHWISFGGATNDYTASKGGTLVDTHGYEKQREKYAIKFVWGNQEVIPSEFWPVNGGKDQAIVLRNTNIEPVLSREGVAAFVKIPDSTFPGVVFEISASDSGEPVDEKDVAILRQIVSSITFGG